MTTRTAQTEAIILKRSNTGECDRVLTLFTHEFGKITVIAKGCRKLNSSRLSFLEPGNRVEVYLIKTKGLPILTQVNLLQEHLRIKNSLLGMKKLLQVLEIIDALTVEEPLPEIFRQATHILQQLNSAPEAYLPIREQLLSIIAQLGFDVNSTAMSLHEVVEQVSERPLRSYNFLTIKS